MRSSLRHALVGSICAVTLASAVACNPTWTKDGKPNDSSMPLPPDASTPQQAGAGSGSSAATAPKP